MRHSPSRTSRSPQGPSLAQWKVGPGLSPQPPLVVHCGLCLGLGRWGLPECMLTSQGLDPSPTPGAAGSIWGNHLEPEGVWMLPQTPRECLFIFLHSHPLGILSSPRTRELSATRPVPHPPSTWRTVHRGGYTARLCTRCPLPALAQAQQAHPAVQVMVIIVHRPGTLPSTFTHYL